MTGSKARERDAAEETVDAARTRRLENGEQGSGRGSRDNGRRHALDKSEYDSGPDEFDTRTRFSHYEGAGLGRDEGQSEAAGIEARGHEGDKGEGDAVEKGEALAEEDGQKQGTEGSGQEYREIETVREAAETRYGHRSHKIDEGPGRRRGGTRSSRGLGRTPLSREE